MRKRTGLAGLTLVFLTGLCLESPMPAQAPPRGVKQGGSQAQAGRDPEGTSGPAATGRAAHPAGTDGGGPGGQPRRQRGLHPAGQRRTAVLHRDAGQHHRHRAFGPQPERGRVRSGVGCDLRQRHAGRSQRVVPLARRAQHGDQSQQRGAGAADARLELHAVSRWRCARSTTASPTASSFRAKTTVTAGAGRVFELRPPGRDDRLVSRPGRPLRGGVSRSQGVRGHRRGSGRRRR